MSDNPTDKRGRIAEYIPLIRAANGLTLSQVCALSFLEPSTIQNWIKRGYVPHPTAKKYHERHLARILLIASLRESMQIDRIGELLCYINGETDDVSDDIITEEALYDLFCDVTDSLCADTPSPDRVEQVVTEILDVHPDAGEYHDKILSAMCIMACAYIANTYKKKSDALFIDSVYGKDYGEQ